MGTHNRDADTNLVLHTTAQKENQGTRSGLNIDVSCLQSGLGSGLSSFGFFVHWACLQLGLGLGLGFGFFVHWACLYLRLWGIAAVNVPYSKAATVGRRPIGVEVCDGRDSPGIRIGLINHEGWEQISQPNQSCHPIVSNQATTKDSELLSRFAT